MLQAYDANSPSQNPSAHGFVEHQGESHTVKGHTENRNSAYLYNVHWESGNETDMKGYGENDHTES